MSCHACGHAFEVPAGSVDAKCGQCGERITLTAMETRAKNDALPDGLDADKMLGLELGGYRLTSVIGGGGMGIVFEAERQPNAQIEGPEIAAVKVLSPAFARDPEFVARFSREADALLSLEHPNLIRVYGKGEHDGAYFFVMERFDGGDLRALMSRGAIPAITAAAIIADAAAGLAHAHAKGIVHRDIKPANILVRGEPGADVVVKVVDFGVAQLAAPGYTLTSLTHSSLILGTVNYMSPEQRIDASNVDHRADVYALGVVAYELLTNRLPIGAFELPSQLVGSISKGADRAVMSALRRDPNHRPASASAFALALQQALQPRSTKPLVFAGVGVLAAFAVAAAIVMMPPSASTKIETQPIEQVTKAPVPVAKANAAQGVAIEEATDAPEPQWTPTPRLEKFGSRLQRDIDAALKASTPARVSKTSKKSKPTLGLEGLGTRAKKVDLASDKAQLK